MEADYFVGLAQQSLWVLALASAPILIPILVVGVLLGMVQAATSINEQTLSFVPKLIVTAICLAIFGSSPFASPADRGPGAGMAPDLKPVMRVRSEIVDLRAIQPLIAQQAG